MVFFFTGQVVNNRIAANFGGAGRGLLGPSARATSPGFSSVTSNSPPTVQQEEAPVQQVGRGRGRLNYFD